MAAGPMLAIRAGKNNRVPVWVDLAALATAGGGDSLTAGSWLSRDNLFIAGGIVGVVLLFFVVRGIIKVLTFLLTIAICAAVLWFTRDRWMQYGHDFAGPEFEAKLSRLA